MSLVLNKLINFTIQVFKVVVLLIIASLIIRLCENFFMVKLITTDGNFDTYPLGVKICLSLLFALHKTAEYFLWLIIFFISLIIESGFSYIGFYFDARPHPVSGFLMLLVLTYSFLKLSKTVFKL